MGSRWDRFLVITGIVTGIIVVALVLVARLLVTFPGAGEGVAQAAERETIQTAIKSMMNDNNLAAVTPSTSGAGGEKIKNTTTQFHSTINMQDHMDQPSTLYCYRWGSDGLMTYQYQVDDNDECSPANHAESPPPCPTRCVELPIKGKGWVGVRSRP